MDEGEQEVTQEALSADLQKLQVDPRSKLKSWIKKTLKIRITDERVIVGNFVCTDREANIIVEDSWEYTQVVIVDEEPRFLGFTLVPGKHIKTIELMTH